MLTGIYQVLVKPVPKRYPNCVDTGIFHLVQVALVDPALPVLRKRRVGSVLAKLKDAVKLGLFIGATNVIPGTVGHPWLNDEVAAQVDAAYLAGGKPGGGEGKEEREKRDEFGCHGDEV